MNVCTKCNGWLITLFSCQNAFKSLDDCSRQPGGETNKSHGKTNTDTVIPSLLVSHELWAHYLYCLVLLFQIICCTNSQKTIVWPTSAVLTLINHLQPRSTKHLEVPVESRVRPSRKHPWHVQEGGNLISMSTWKAKADWRYVRCDCSVFHTSCGCLLERRV